MSSLSSRDPRLSDQALLAKLVAFPSVSCDSSRPIADFVCEYATGAGCRIWRQEYDDARKSNVLVWRGPWRDGGLLLSGHLDVVPADETGWETPPFELTQCGDELRGRGSADMKGFVAQALNLLAAQRDDALRYPLALLLSSDEEVGSLGAQQFVSAWTNDVPLPRNAIIGEPTCQRVVRMHKGHLKLRLTVAGRAAHSGYPYLGISAIERAIPLLELLRGLRIELAEMRADVSEYFAECPYPALNIGLIAGGSAVNIIPDRCRIDLGVRLLPGQRSDEFIAKLETRLAQLPADIRDATTLEVVNDSPPMLCDKNAAMNIQMARLLKQCDTVGVDYASDAGTLQRLGVRCVLFGAGDIRRAHRANEGLPIREWETARGFLEQAIRKFCVEGVDE